MQRSKPARGNEAMESASAERQSPRLDSDGAAARKRAAVETYARNETTLRRTARRFSLCEDDADDALQRALEILLRKAPRRGAAGAGQVDADGGQARGAGDSPRARADP